MPQAGLGNMSPVTSSTAFREAQRKVCTLRTVYTETERALYIHTRQLNIHQSDNQDLHYEEGSNFKHLVEKLKAYNETLHQCEKELEPTSEMKQFQESLKKHIWDLKAVKFEPAVTENSSAVGYLVEYSINDLCYVNHLTHTSTTHTGNYGNGVDKLSGCHGSKLIELHPDKMSSSPSAPNLMSMSSGFVSGGSQLSLLSESAEFHRHDSRRFDKISTHTGNDPAETHKTTSHGLLWTKKLRVKKVRPAPVTTTKLPNKGSRRTVATRAAISSNMATNAASEDVAMLPDGRIIATDINNHQLTLISNEGNVVRELGQSKLTNILGDWKLRPQCVASYGSKEIYCTDLQDKCIKQFDVDSGRCTSSIPLTSYSRPFGLAILPDGKFVVTHCDDFITIHDPASGRTLKTINADGNFWYVCTDARNRIITSDCSNHCIRIFDANGESIQTLGHNNNVPQARLSYPHGVCVGKLGQILVADSLNNRVCRFSASGHFLDTVLGDDVIQWPRGLATDGTQVAVTWQGGVSLADMPVTSSASFLSSYL